MSKLVAPHGSSELKPLLLSGPAREAELERSKSLPRVIMTSRETGDLIMLGIGGFTPLTGFMNKADWKGVCDEMRTSAGVFWPVPITLSADRAVADSLKEGAEVALIAGESGEIMGTMKVTEKYTIDKGHECREVFRTEDPAHPGVKMVMEQKPVNLAGPVKVLSESYFPRQFAGIYQRPAEARQIFEAKGWSTVAALQLRNPMHRSHEYLAKIAIEVCDGVYIHQLLGRLKPGDIPADVRVRAIQALVDHYFVKDTAIQGGYPLDMRYAGPREALLHALFRQNYGCSHMIIGRDHAGVGNYYGPFDAQKIFDEIPRDALLTRPLKIDWTFWCNRCEGMASMRTCPHGKEDRVLLSGTAVRKALSEGGELDPHFSRPEVAAILREYYSHLSDKVEIQLHRAATGE
ncbi:MAG TPA: sulfate adenylyltransferase [Phycisphaerae bacterium]|mgnify:CR=1 FL=1|nr:sulfate adenylyltransferase [Phycisphaerae bacterium]